MKYKLQEKPKIPTIDEINKKYHDREKFEEMDKDSAIQYINEVMNQLNDEIEDDDSIILMNSHFGGDYPLIVFMKTLDLISILRDDKNTRLFKSERSKKYSLEYTTSLLNRMYLIEEEFLIIKLLNIDKKLLKQEIHILENIKKRRSNNLATNKNLFWPLFDGLIAALEESNIDNDKKIDFIFDLFRKYEFEECHKMEDDMVAEIDDKKKTIRSMVNRSIIRIKNNKKLYPTYIPTSK